MAWRIPGFSFWVTLGLSSFTLMPFLSLAIALASPAPLDWDLVQARLPGLAANSLCLLAGVVLSTGVLGTGLAWLTSRCDFPGRAFFDSALLLPLAVPAYVQACVVLDLINTIGPAESFCGPNWPRRDLSPSFAMGGLILSFCLAYYPFVYLAARYGFQTRSARAMEAARSLGAGPIWAFFRAGLPVAWPWISLSLGWIGLETLADLGAVSVFRYETFSTALYQAWVGAGALPVAARLAGWLMVLACGLIGLGLSLGKRFWRYPSPATGIGQPARLSNLAALCALACVALVLGLAFVVPLGHLSIWKMLWDSPPWAASLLEPITGSLGMALTGASLATLMALSISVAKRSHSGPRFGWMARTATLGFFLPGILWAAGLVGVGAILDDYIAGFFQALKLPVPSLFESGIPMLLATYLFRFVGLPFLMTDRAMGRVTQTMEDSAAGLGVTGTALWRQVYLPLLWRDLLGAFLLAFLALLHELPITLLLRPAGLETLPTRLFEMTSLGQWAMPEQTALPSLALILVLAGVAAVFGLIRTGAFRHG